MRLLGEYRPIDDDERQFLERMLVLVSATADPLSRQQTAPGHFTASAFLVSADERAALLIHHPVLKLWLQPGGHIEPSDAGARDSALREVLEETGIAATAANTLFDVDIHLIPARRSVPAHLHFDLRFLVPVKGMPTAAFGELEGQWFTHQRITTDVADNSVRRMADKARAAGIL
jgi:8-oxo-dGTP pyrophosphatase MutT (NUDIX family)